MKKTRRLNIIVYAAIFVIFLTGLFTSDQAIASSASAVKSVKSKKTAKPASRVDHNAIGFKAFQKRDFKAALKSFDLSIKNDPRSAFGFLNRARALVAINVKVDPEDYCAYESNWVYLALSSLSKAIDVNRKQVVAKLKEVKEPSFTEFKKRPEYIKWQSTLQLPIAGDEGLKKFIFANPQWISREPAMVPTLVTLRSDLTANVLKPDGQNSEGKWRVENGKVIVDSKLLGKALTLKVIPFYFNEGKNYIHSTILADGARAELYIGPVTEDCS